MIEIEAEILRGSCMPVFFVGETIECEIRFRCVPHTLKNQPPTNRRKNSSSGSEQSGLTSASSHASLTSLFSSKVKYVDLNETANSSTTTIDEKKLNEINQSMFSLLAAYPSTASMSNASSSIPTTPTDSLAGTMSRLLAPMQNSRSLYTITSTSGSDHQLTSGSETPVAEDPECIVAWACVQLDCNCYIDESKVALPKIPLRYNIYSESEASSNTSFQPNRDRHGLSIYSSKPKILFCNLCLRPNEQKSFIYRETLPYDLAPSFRGQFARYTYKLTIGAQKLNRNTQLLRLPFRVFSLLDFDKFIPKSDNSENGFVKNKRESMLSTEISESRAALDGDGNDEAKEKSNPFKVVEKSQFENLEYALQILDDLTSRLNTTHFNVANEDGRIVKITLSKTNYKIGDKLVVFMDFSEAQISCVEFKVTLQSEEVISEECRKKVNQMLSSINSFVELQEHTLFMKKTNFTMQIPVTVTPTFVSDIISLRWRLHFDFALSKTPIQRIHRSNDPVMSLSWRPPGSLSVQVMSWDLPIILHPFDPFVASDLIIPTTVETNTLTIR